MIFDTGQNGGKENVSMILIDYKDRRPLYEQIVEKLSDLIVRGILEQDSQLPSVRSLATELSMNPNTIQRAYAELERQGYIYSIKGKGSFVAQISPNIVAEELNRQVEEQFAQAIAKARRLGLTREEILELVVMLLEDTSADSGDAPEGTEGAS